jgi:hypothetical protein
MFWALYRVQKPRDFLRAWHNRKLLRWPAGWNIIFYNPRPFEGNTVDNRGAATATEIELAASRLSSTK